MRIYVTHSGKLNYHDELYLPIRSAESFRECEIILPHEDSEKSFDSRRLLLERSVDLVIAEVSFSSLGQGIELGWADAFGVPIVAIVRTGFSFSRSLSVVCQDVREYNGDNVSVVKVIENIISDYEQSKS
ncbi:MAG: hypothetical protein KC736_02400 [Candidatus Moranbacteria bacterium]|nr:hypothetical protein [Candidatus Moranbacteria bacterium]